ncbi:MAG: hypothetical protein ACI4MM_06085 [Candidatus Ventricola sp.]
MRDRTIDVSRGLLVIMMVYGHVLQFFGDGQLFPLVNDLINVINLTVFGTFVFCFGATAGLAYLNKPYRRALPGMVKTALRAYVAFCLSGIGYRVLRENKPFAVGAVRRVLTLADIPGWSEFLIAFALYSLLLIVGFSALRWLSRRPLASLAVGAACVACCLVVPYSAIPHPLGLLIGGTDFAYFPVVQYMPYFLAGLLYAQGERWRLLAAAVLCTATGAVDFVLHGLPGRFPPDWGWILLPALFVAAVVVLSRALCALPGGGVRRIADGLCGLLGSLGSASLYYLLTSNLVLFTLAGKKIAPALSARSVLPWSQPIQAPLGAACWTAVLLGALWFVSLLAGRGKGHKTA